MIDVVYTGDVRGTQEVARQNHQLFFEELSKVSKFQVHQFTSPTGEKRFLPCPYDRGGKDLYWLKENLRRGQGGAVQVWQFMNAVRTDQKSIYYKNENRFMVYRKINRSCNYRIKRNIKGNYDVGYFGSNWLEGTIGTEHEKILVKEREDINVNSMVEDFLIVCKRDKLKSYEEVIKDMNTYKNNKLRSGNKMFRLISNKQAKAFKNLCQIYLMRTTYNKGYPTDKQVCYDYLMSYCKSEHEAGKMEPSLEWWRNKEWK
jgi:hypothetical protein